MHPAEANPIAILRYIDDHAAFSRLPQTVQSDVLLKLGWMIRYNVAPCGEKGATASQAARVLGITFSSFHRHVSRYRQYGWRGLIDGRIRPSRRANRNH